MAIKPCRFFQSTTITLIYAVLFSMVLNGCAIKPAGPPASAAAPAKAVRQQWQCDPEADKAVESGDIEAGLHAHARFVTEHPDNPLARYHLGYAFGLAGDIAHEIAQYEAALSLGYIHDEQLFFNLGMAYAETGQDSKAVDAFEKALALDPDSIDTLSELEVMYQKMGEIRNERRILERHLELEPDNDAVRQRLDIISKK